MISCFLSSLIESTSLTFCYLDVNPCFKILFYLFQEINGITAALAEELFHKGALPLT